MIWGYNSKNVGKVAQFLREILVQMIKLKLESEEESTMALELIRFIKKSWLVQDQTVLGKDYSNLLIADSLLKTIWFINAPCYDNEALASPNTNDEELSIPEQTATGKGTSNPLMAGSLPKTKKPTLSYRTLQNKGILIGCSRHITCEQGLLADFQDSMVALLPLAKEVKAILLVKVENKNVSSENQANIHAGQQESNQNTGTKDKIDAGDSEKEDESAPRLLLKSNLASYSHKHICFQNQKMKRGRSNRGKTSFSWMILPRLQRLE
ncbi:hypothetical protein Tco_0112233 [Tanacetum coccineum]